MLADENVTTPLPGSVDENNTWFDELPVTSVIVVTVKVEPDPTKNQLGAPTVSVAMVGEPLETNTPEDAPATESVL